MKIKIDEERIREILRFIEDKDSFIVELVSAINEASNDAIEACLEEWEASAELNSIPGFAEKVRKRFDSLVKSGIIND